MKGNQSKSIQQARAHWQLPLSIKYKVPNIYLGIR